MSEDINIAVNFNKTFKVVMNFNPAKSTTWQTAEQKGKNKLRVS